MKNLNKKWYSGEISQLDYCAHLRSQLTPENAHELVSKIPEEITDLWIRLVKGWTSGEELVTIGRGKLLPEHPQIMDILHSMNKAIKGE